MCKVCIKCGATKAEEEFRRYSDTGKLAAACKACSNAEQRARDLASPRKPHDPEQSRAWLEGNYVGYLLSSARQRAKKRSVDFSLTREDICIPDLCPVLGMPLQINHGTPCDASPNLDRLDPSKGYVQGNVVVISNKANRIKSNATSDEVMAVAKWMKQKGL